MNNGTLVEQPAAAVKAWDAGKESLPAECFKLFLFHEKAFVTYRGVSEISPQKSQRPGGPGRLTNDAQWLQGGYANEA